METPVDALIDLGFDTWKNRKEFECMGMDAPGNLELEIKKKRKLGISS